MIMLNSLVILSLGFCVILLDNSLAASIYKGQLKNLAAKREALSNRTRQLNGTTHPNAILNLFKKNFKSTLVNSEHPKLTTDWANYWMKQKNNSKISSLQSVAGSPASPAFRDGAGGGAAAKNDTTNNTTVGDPTTKDESRYKELTISIPRFHKDKFGNWVYNLWGVTFGQVWRDTRFNEGRKIATHMRMRVDEKPVRDYYPGNNLSTVCQGRSTIYNSLKVSKWLGRNVYNFTIRQRAIWDGLRKQVYKFGRSEECHAAIEDGTWRDYIECAIRRNQRVEYLVPQYPLHQIGYNAYYTKYVVEIPEKGR